MTKAKTLVKSNEKNSTISMKELASRVSRLEQHLENYKNVGNTPFQKGDGNCMKINRAVMIGGEKHWIRANTEQEYADKIIRLYAGEPTTVVKHNFEKYAITWFEVYALPRIEKATVATYKRQLARYLIPHFGKMSVEEITVDDVQRLFNDISGTKATKDKVKNVLNMILEAAVEDGLLDRNPLKSRRLRITGEASKTTKPYTQEEMRYIAANLDKIRSSSDQQYFVLLAFHPLRLEEVLGLKWEDIDLEARIIHVRRAVTHPDRNKPEIKSTKTAASVRDVGLSAIAIPYLVPGKPGDFVCGNSKPLSYSEVRRMNVRIGKQLKFDGSIVPQRFRTTVLTDLYDKTKDIKQTQAAAGHTTSAMTLKHYVKGRCNDPLASAAAVDAVYSST